MLDANTAIHYIITIKTVRGKTFGDFGIISREIGVLVEECGRHWFG